ncbi:DNA gyrase subunit B [Mycolicibacterium conceptionense]|uniref:DNA topoisomerase (ATP-hydrolyzing) n=1 Tax=Mycolicibacterium conceptionense TaxID=451644 RepID=A0A0J8WP94_9MYCO|nr:toprim domain-containing protein [Mycolicibacterium conceptionense]KMV14854.1 DNA gyrase subunit B [Mycolicibacterium conceptionense]
MSYTTADIDELDRVEFNRLRPNVNLGSHVYQTAAREFIDNAIEEAGAHGSAVSITLHADGSFTVADDGRGLPVDTDPKTGKNGIVKTIGTEGSGGKFRAHSDANATGAGLNGTGAAVAVFISRRVDVTVHKGGKAYMQSFRDGRPGTFTGTEFDPDASFTRDDTMKLRGSRSGDANAHGTTLRVLLDPAIAPDTSLNMSEILLRAHAAVRMTPGVRLTVTDEGWPGDEIPAALLESFTGPWGVEPVLDLMCVSEGTPAPTMRAVVEGRGEYMTGRGATPLRWSLVAGPAEPVTAASFCNTVYTPGGGSHLTAALKGLTEALAERAGRIRDLGLAKGEDAPEAQDFATVTSLAVDTRAPDVPWNGQDKLSFTSRSMNLAMTSDVQRSVTVWAANPANTATVTAWSKLALVAARARRSAEGAKARSRAASKAKGLGTNLSLPGKLLPSRESGRGSGAELFICEGDSALGTIKGARDATFQAAFPLKGKPPNVYGWTAAKARSKEEFDSIERILGCGVRDHCDPEQCRYDRILFASDADPDGGNINSSLISMFLDFYRPLVEAGMIYVTLPPLFVVSAGAERVYCQDEAERDEAVARLRASAKGKVEVQRNKGLGEMNADDFWNTVLDPAVRSLIRVGLDTPADQLHHTLFGGPPEGRRTWMADAAARIDMSTLDLD